MAETNTKVDIRPRIEPKTTIKEPHKFKIIYMTTVKLTDEQLKEIETYKKVDHAEEAAKTTDAPPFLIQTYLDNMAVEPVQEIPPYSKLTPEVFDIFQKMIGMISPEPSKWIWRTRFLMPGCFTRRSGNVMTTIMRHVLVKSNEVQRFVS